MTHHSSIQGVLAYVGGGSVASLIASIAAPPRNANSPLAPPAPVIGGVWTALFAAMGVARGELRHEPRLRATLDRLWLLCAAYPAYTAGFRFKTGAYAGNAIIAGVATDFLMRASARAPGAARLVAPVMPWVALTTLALLTEQPRRAAARA